MNLLSFCQERRRRRRIRKNDREEKEKNFHVSKAYNSKRRNLEKIKVKEEKKRGRIKREKNVFKHNNISKQYQQRYKQKKRDG